MVRARRHSNQLSLCTPLPAGAALAARPAHHTVEHKDLGHLYGRAGQQARGGPTRVSLVISAGVAPWMDQADQTWTGSFVSKIGVQRSGSCASDDARVLTTRAHLCVRLQPCLLTIQWLLSVSCNTPLITSDPVGGEPPELADRRSLPLARKRRFWSVEMTQAAGRTWRA